MTPDCTTCRYLIAMPPQPDDRPALACRHPIEACGVDDPAKPPCAEATHRAIGFAPR